MYHILFNEQEIEYLKQLITEKINTYGGEDSKTIEAIQRKLEDPENADGYYDAVDY
tara:strand:+ start:364 stop:531 length:168 start_codon:yes stop_codon:yes gene_type:complete